MPRRNGTGSAGGNSKRSRKSKKQSANGRHQSLVGRVARSISARIKNLVS